MHAQVIDKVQENEQNLKRNDKRPAQRGRGRGRTGDFGIQPRFLCPQFHTLMQSVCHDSPHKRYEAVGTNFSRTL